MPLNPRFNSVLGGAFSGMLRTGRNPTLAELLAGAAMGSTAAVEFEDEQARRLQLEEERRAQEEEDRKWRQEQRDLQRQEQERRLADIANQERASASLTSYVSQFEPGFTGPVREDIPMDAFPTPEGRLKYLQDKAGIDDQAAEQERVVKFLLDNGVQPTPFPDVNKKLVQSIADPKPDFTPEQLYQHGRDAQRDQEKEDDSWREQFTGSLESSRFDKREGPAVKAWDEAFKRNLSLVKSNDATQSLPPDKLIEEAKRLTDEEVGYNKGGLVSPSMPNLGRPKAPPKNEQPIPDFAGNLPPSGAEIASPTGAQAPPSISGNQTKVLSGYVGKKLAESMPELPPEKLGPALVQILGAIGNAKGAEREAIIERSLQVLRMKYERSLMHQGSLMGTPGGN